MIQLQAKGHAYIKNTGSARYKEKIFESVIIFHLKDLHIRINMFC